MCFTFFGAKRRYGRRKWVSNFSYYRERLANDCGDRKPPEAWQKEAMRKDNEPLTMTGLLMEAATARGAEFDLHFYVALPCDNFSNEQ
jgi:hypothetical protein